MIGEQIEALAALMTGPAARRMLLVFLRLVWIVSFTPLFGGEQVPKRLRIGIAMVLTLILSSVATEASPEDLEGTSYAELMAKECLVGILFAVFIRIAFELLSSAGAVIDVVRGASMATVLDPMTRDQNPVLKSFLLQLVLVLFLGAGGHGNLLEALHRSFDTIRIDAEFSEVLAERMDPRAMLALIGGLFSDAIRIAAPVIAIMFLVDLALALVARAAPQIQVYFLGLAAKGTLGLFVLVLILPGRIPDMVRLIFDYLDRAMGG